MTAGAGKRVLVVTNMWPTSAADYTGIFVQQQVAALRELAPDWTFDVLDIAGERGRIDYLAAVPRVRRALATGYDLVHAHYGFTGTTVALARPGIPLIVTLHGNDVNWRWQRAISRVGARFAARVIAVSEDMRARFGRTDAIVLACGIPMDLFRPELREEARSRLAIAPDAKVVLFPAAPDNPVKDYALFSAALREVPVELAAVERVLGKTPPSEVPHEMAAADVVVLTSVTEGSPMVVKEALAAGTPVVSVDVGDVARVIDGLPGCAIVARDAAAIADGIAATLRAGSREERAVAARRQRILELGLDGAGIARQLLALYTDTLR